MSLKAYRSRGRLSSSAKEKSINDLYAPSIENWPSLRLASVRHFGRYTEQGPAIDRLYAWAALHGIQPTRLRNLNLLHDDPFVTPPGLRSVDVCIVLEAAMVGAGDVSIFELPPARYVSVIHQGPYSELDQPYFWLTRWWLPQSMEKPAAGPFLVEYLRHPADFPPDQWLSKLCIPIV